MPCQLRRRLGRLILAVAVAAVAAIGLAPAASADVYISPSQAVQGSATRITFHVHNHRAGVYTTELQVDLPADAPVAEVFPLTVPDWAPEILYRAADRPLPGIHGSGLTEATSSVIWTRATDAPPAPTTEELQLEMGPLPAVSEYVFGITQTSSDGTVQQWRGRAGSSGADRGRGTVLTLLPPDGTAPGEPAASPAAGHGVDHGNDPLTTEVSALEAAQAPAGQVKGTSLSLRPVAGVLVLGIALGLLVWAGRRGGRDPLSEKAEDDEPENDEKERAATTSVAAAERWHA